jgi:hypothetical protein
MTIFTCETCKHEFSRQRFLNDHLNRKNPCKPTDIMFNKPIKPQNNIQQDDKQDENDENDKNTCNFCGLVLSRSDSLRRHLGNFCKVRKEQILEKEQIFKRLLLKETKNEELQQQIFALLNQNKLLIEQYQKKDDELIKKNEQIIDLINEVKKPKVNKSKVVSNSNNNTVNNVNSNNTVNNTVNIQIAQFGKENFDEIDNKHFEKIIRNPRILGVKVPEEILKIMHFNPDYPQFQNFFVSDFNRDRIMVHDGEAWILETPDKIKSVLEQIITFSKDKLEQYKDKKLSDEVMNRLTRIEDAINKCDDDFIADLKEMAEEGNVKILEKIKHCEKFQKDALGKIKKTSYNEGKKMELLRKFCHL